MVNLTTFWWGINDGKALTKSCLTIAKKGRKYILIAKFNYGFLVLFYEECQINTIKERNKFKNHGIAKLNICIEYWLYFL